MSLDEKNSETALLLCGYFFMLNENFHFIVSDLKLFISFSRSSIESCSLIDQKEIDKPRNSDIDRMFNYALSIWH